MKKVILLILLFSLSSIIYADEYATTDSGKKVLLKNDGTWEFIKQEEKQEKGLKITDWKWSNFSGSLKIEGIVENYTNNTYDWTRVIISAKDANDKYLGNTDTYLKPKLIRPGGTSTFETYILNVTNNTSRLSISYSFDGDIIR